MMLCHLRQARFGGHLAWHFGAAERRRLCRHAYYIDANAVRRARTMISTSAGAHRV